MKKTISMLIVLALVLSMMPTAVFAADAVTITFETDFTNDLAVGESFTVTASLAGNPTIGTMTFALKWNEKAIAFSGFQMNGRVLASKVFDTSLGYQSPTVNSEIGKIVAVDELGYDLDGVLFTANFTIVGEGELGIGLKTDTAYDFQIRNLEGTEDVPANLDFSAVEGLTVGGLPVGPEMPEDAPFTAITTDAGPIVAVEYVEDVEFNYGYVPYYIVTIPTDATTAYVTAPDQVVMEDWTTGAMQATGYAADLEDMSTPLYISYNYEDTEDGPKVEIPMEMTSSDWSGNEINLCFFSNDEYNPATHAFGIEDANYACLGLISFVYGEEAPEEEEIYTITIDASLVGGTITVANEDGEPITEAAAGDYVFVTVTPASGYTGNSYTINGQIANDFIFQMPAENVLLSAAFTEIHTCDYSAEVVDTKYQKSEATCLSGAVYYKSCTCGEFATTAETFVSGDPVDHVYAGGTCKWCGAAEPVATPGYTFATSADQSAENDGNAVVKVMITGHTNPDVNYYNAYDLTLTFDNTKLELVDWAGAVKSDNGSVTVEGNTIRIVGCGANKEFGTEVAALTFKTLAEGAANITIDKVQVSDREESIKENAPEATPKHDENDTTNKDDETPSISVIVVPYTVTKPAFVSGADKVIHGENYTFSFTDTANYTYSDLVVKVGGVEVDTLTVDENGVYTIANVNGAVEITATQTANSYKVTKPENVSGEEYATYGTDYVFTIKASEGKIIESVTVTLADGTTVPYTWDQENNQNIIDGENIVGEFTITVTEVDAQKQTTVHFVGVTSNEIVGGATQTAVVGQAYEFRLNEDAENYTYTAKVGETVLTANAEGVYTIPGTLVVAEGVTVTIVKTEIKKLAVEVAEYFNVDTKTMFLVTAKWGDKVLAWGEDAMIYSAKYTVTGYDAGAYCWLVMSTDEMNTVELVKAAAEAAIVEGASAETVQYNCDINGTTKVDVNDAQVAYDMYNAQYTDFSNDLPMLKFLEADMVTDGKLDTKDVAAIINVIVYGANA